MCHMASRTLDGTWLSENGESLVTRHRERKVTVFRCWDVPFQRPWELVIGIPAGLVRRSSVDAVA
jgi:hypothetical protein